MQAALQGVLVGLGIGILLLFFEYVMLSKEVKERAKKYHRNAEFDVTERRRMHSMLRFALILPLGFAAAFWLVWG